MYMSVAVLAETRCQEFYFFMFCDVQILQTREISKGIKIKVNGIKKYRTMSKKKIITTWKRKTGSTKNLLSEIRTSPCGGRSKA